MTDREDSSMFFSDPEGDDWQNIMPSSTLERTSLSMSSDTSQSLSNEFTTSLIKQEDGEGFRPALDVPRNRNSKDARYHKIAEIKVEGSVSDEESEAQVLGAGSDNGTLRQKRAGSATSFDLERELPVRKRAAHKRSEGPSMSKGAVDYRERKSVEADYQARFAELLDHDIVQQVDQEGGITPQGRLFKAGVRMLERVERERELRTLPPSGETSVGDAGLKARALKAEEQLKQCKLDLEAVWRTLS